MTLAVDRLKALPTPVLRAIRSELGPTFANPQQERFFDSQASELLYSGAYRAGKSRIGCEKAFYLAKRYPGIPIGIFRKTAASLAASTERTLLHDVIPRGAITRHNRTERWYELANGSRIWFFGLDPDPITGLPSKVGSVELGWAFIDEAAECAETDWSMVKGRLSWPGIPYHQVAAATNPASPKHWLKVRFTPPTEHTVYLHASTFDNPLLPEDYVADANRAADGYLKRRYIMGEWVGAEGVIWTLPDDQVREADTQEFKRVVGGVDWGFVHAFAAEIVGQTGTGKLAVIDEMYERGETIDRIIPILKMLQDRTPNFDRFYADPSEPAYILQCQRAGIRIEGARNDMAPGIGAVSMAIARGMTVAPSCTGLLNEMPGYTWAPNRQGGFHEKPVDINDDACFVAGTMVRTADGDVPIERVTVGTQVWTRGGLRRVYDAAMTSRAASVMDVRFSDGSSLRCTPNHRIWTRDGWKRADALRYDEVCTRPPLATRLGVSGPRRTALSLTGMRYIIGTAMSRTTPWTTSNVSTTPHTSPAMWQWARTGRLLGSITLPLSDPSLWTGTAQPMVAVRTRTSVEHRGVGARNGGSSVTSADGRLRRARAKAMSGSVVQRVGRRLGGRQEWTMRLASVRGVVQTIGRAVIPGVWPAPVRVVGISLVPGRQPVYNISVLDRHEYFANGVLVANCDALRYAVVALEPSLEENPWAQLAGQRVGATA